MAHFELCLKFWHIYLDSHDCYYNFSSHLLSLLSLVFWCGCRCAAMPLYSIVAIAMLFLSPRVSLSLSWDRCTLKSDHFAEIYLPNSLTYLKYKTLGYELKLGLIIFYSILYQCVYCGVRWCTIVSVVQHNICLLYTSPSPRD